MFRLKVIDSKPVNANSPRAGGALQFSPRRAWAGVYAPLIRLLGASLLCAACGGQAKSSALPSSANQPRYALEHPSALEQARTDFDERENEAREGFGKFADFPAKIPTEHHATAHGVLSTAAAEGRSQDYARAAYETELIEDYFSEEKLTFQQKVGGAAQYTAKQAGCKADVASPAVHALNKTVEKSLEERLDSHSDAQRQIDEHEEALGAENSVVLREQARAVSRTSYLVHIATLMAKTELESKLAEAEQVKQTLKASEERDTQRSSDSALSESERKKATERATKAREAAQLLETELKLGQEQLKTYEDRHKQLTADFEKALAELLKAVEGK